MNKMHKKLKRAIQGGDLNDVLSLINDQGVSVNWHETHSPDFFSSVKVSYSESPIQWALETDNPLILDAVLKAPGKTSINNRIYTQPGKGNNVISPIYWAVLHQRPRMVEVLLSHYKKGLTLETGGYFRDKNNNIIRHFQPPYELAKAQNDNKTAILILETLKKQKCDLLQSYNEKARKTARAIENINTHIKKLENPETPARHNNPFKF